MRGSRDLNGVVARKDDVVNAAESAVPVIAKRLQGLLREDDIRDLAQASGQPASHIVPFVHANWGLHVAVNEDTLKYVVFNELIKSGISITQLALEYPHPEIDKARIDTVVVDENYVPEIAVEFKYHHRLPSRRNRDRTAAVGQLLADFSRLGRFPDVQRLVVYLTDDEMLKYFSSQSNGLTMLIDPNQRHKIASDTIPTTTTLRKYAGDWSNGVWLQMIGNWEVGIGHEMIVWQVEPL